MTEETFDEVTQDDQVVGSTTKAIAHTEARIHRVVAVYVILPNGLYCIQVHQAAGQLDHSVGGHVTAGETYEEAAQREAFEELNISAPLRFLGTFYSDETYTGSPVRHFFGVYEMHAPSDWKFTPNEEVRAAKEMKLEEIVASMDQAPERFTPGFINTMEYYLKAIHSDLTLNLTDYKKSRLSF